MKKLRFAFKADSVHVIIIWIIILLLIAQLIVTTVTYKKYMSDTEYNYIISLFEKQVYADEEMMNLINKNISTLINDKNIIDYFESSETDDAVLKHTGEILRNYIQLMSGKVKGIYLYRENENTLLNMYGNKLTPQNLHFEALELNLSAPASEKKSFVSFFDMQNNSVYRPQAMYCFFPDKNSNDACIMEFNIGELIRPYQRLCKLPVTDLFVTTSNGDLIFSSDTEYSSNANIYNDSLFEPLRKLEQNTYYESFKKNDCFYFMSQSIPFKYIVCTDKSLINHSANGSTNYIFLYISILLSAVLIFRVYWIFLNITAKIKKLSANSKKHEENENDLYIVNTYLNAPNDKHAETFGNILKKNFTKNKYAVIHINIESIDDSIYDENPHSQRIETLYIYGIDNIVKEIFLNHEIEMMQFHSMQNSIEYIAAFDGETTEYYSAYHKAADLCSVSINKYINAAVSFYTSKITTTDNLNKEYDSIPQLISYRYLSERCVVIDPRILEEHTDSNVETKLEQLKNEFSVLLCNPCANLLPILEEYEETLASGDNKLTKNTLWDIIYELRCCNKEYYFSHINATALLFTIENSRSMHDVFNQLRTELTFLSLKNNDRTKNTTPYPDAIAKSLRYIEEMYSDQNLCPKYIANEVGLNPTYLNRLFKNTMGISIVNSIKEKRLSAAIPLLLDYKVPIKSVAERVGFSSSNYFIVSFKQEYGITPAQYRNNNIIKNEDSSAKNGGDWITPIRKRF